MDSLSDNEEINKDVQETIKQKWVTNINNKKEIMKPPYVLVFCFVRL